MKSNVTRRYSEFGRTHLRPTLLERDRDARFDRVAWDALAREGFFKLLVPVEHGGSATDPRAGLVQAMHAVYGLASGSLDAPWISSVSAHGLVGIDLLTRFATPAQLSRYLPDAIEGRSTLAICNSEEGCGTNLKRITSRLITDDGIRGTLSARKSCSTNGSFADVAMISAWAAYPGREATIEVLIAHKEEATEQRNLAATLSGYRTGMTGSFDVSQLPLTLAERRLGGEGSGLKVFRRCYHMERLIITVFIAGVIDGMLEESLALLHRRDQAGSPIASNQYVQEKIIRIYSARERILALIEGVLTQPEPLSDANDKALSLCKWTAHEEGALAAVAFAEICGHASLLNDHVAQKLVRDFTALRFFGGTQELHKKTIFETLYRESAPADARRPAKRPAA